MNPNSRTISIFAETELHLEDLKQDLRNVEQKLSTLQAPRFVPGGGVEMDDELRLQGKILQLKMRRLNLKRTIEALERAATGRGHLESVDSKTTFAMEAVINYRYRPALVFNQDHSFRQEDVDSLGLMENGKGSWKDLINALMNAPSHKRGLCSLGKSVARVEHANGAVVGTAWSFEKRRLLSNRHVFLDSGWYYQASSKWVPVDGRQGVLNFMAVDGATISNRSRFDVDQLITNPGPDASRIIADSDSPFVLEPVLDKSELVGSLEGRLVAVVGHPTSGDGNPADEVAQVFDNAPLKLKRFMPGRLSPQKACGTYGAGGSGVPVLMHDCSTLKGASGSCVIDLGPADSDPKKLLEENPTFGKVIGLHFGGLWSESNFAVPTWALSDTLLKSNPGTQTVQL